MASFNDKHDLEWVLALDGPTILTIREECDPKFLLGDHSENNTSTRLADDPALLCQVIYLLCAKQRDDRGVSLESFYRDVIGNGESIQAAGEALEKAIENFTTPRKREFAKAIAEKQREVQRMGQEKILAKIKDPALMENVSAQLDKEINRILMRLGSATSSPASSESTPPA